MATDVAQASSPAAGLPLQHTIVRIAEEGRYLKWVPAEAGAGDGHYLVLDGQRFEEHFNATRRRKRLRTGGVSDTRSFSGMNKHFVLLSGDGWARTGSRFRPRNAAAPAPVAEPTAVCKDVKYCFQCGHGSTKEEQPHCPKCGNRSWTRAAGEVMSTIQTLMQFIKLEAALLNQKQVQEATLANDVIVTGSQQDALAALRAAVATAAAAEAQEQRQQGGERKGLIWELRGVHLGAGICRTKSLDDLLLAFIMWAEEPRPDNQETSSFNVSMAMRKLTSLACFQEEHFDFFSEPLEVAEIPTTSDELGQIYLPRRTSSSGQRICTTLYPPDSLDSLIKSHSESLGSHSEDLVRRVMRMVFGTMLCMCFDDACVSKGLLAIEDMRACKTLFRMTKQWTRYCACDGAAMKLWYLCTPIRTQQYVVLDSRIYWWQSWSERIYSFLLMSTDASDNDQLQFSDGAYTDALLGGQVLSWPSAVQEECGVSRYAAIITGSNGRWSGEVHLSPKRSSSSSTDGSTDVSTDACVIPCPFALEDPTPTSEYQWFLEDLSVDDLGVGLQNARAGETVVQHPGIQSARDQDQTAMNEGSMEEFGQKARPGYPQACKALTESMRQIFIHDPFTEYALQHMKIKPSEFKFTALSRIRDVYELLHALEVSGVVRIDSQKAADAAAGDADADRTGVSIFGFSRLVVRDKQRFNDAVAKMVTEDSSRCWKVNGRQCLHQPAGPVYELLRQLGIRPVKVSCPSNAFAQSAQGVSAHVQGACAFEISSNAPGSRDFLAHSEYEFSFDRMLKNCDRLRIGAIGNRRPTGHDDTRCAATGESPDT